MYARLILRLIENCEQALKAGRDPAEVRNQLLPQLARRALHRVPAADFLRWSETVPDYAAYCREIRSAGLWGTPPETARMVLETIVLDALQG